MLTKNQLKQLRKEICLNSLFLKDYNNSFYIKEKTVCDFMDSYIEYLHELASDDNYNGDDVIDRYDNIDNLYNYYCLFEDDPLIKDDYIAVCTLSYFNGVLIYDIDGDDVITASYYNEGCNNVMHINRITKNNIYYDSIGDPYIIKDKTRYCLSDFIRVDYRYK